MGFLVKKQTEKFLRDKKRRKRWMAMFLCLALLVTSGTFAALRMDGRAMDDDGNAESGTEVYDESLYAGEPVQDGAQGEQEETGGSLDGEGIGEDMGEDLGENAGEDAGQPETDSPDTGDAKTGGQPSEDPGTGDAETGEQPPEDPDTETAGPNEDIEGGQTDEGNTPEEEAQQPDEQISEIRKNVIAIAESQIGYTYEDYQDFDEEGICREDWTALFASYSLITAGVGDIQLETDSRQWMDSLEQAGRLDRDGTYSLQPGDIVFYGPAPETPEASEAPEDAYGLTGEDEANEANEEGTVLTEGAADTDAVRAGLVKKWNAETGEIQIIAGDVEIDGVKKVGETTYSLSPENPEDPQINIKACSQIPETAAQEPGTENDTPEEPGIDGETVSDPDAGTVSPNAVTMNTGEDETDGAQPGTADSGIVSWGGDPANDVKPTKNEEGVTIWDVSDTKHRNLNIPVRINPSGQWGEDTTIEIIFPQFLNLGNAGRTVSDKNGNVIYTYKPTLDADGIPNGWSKEVNGDTVTITSNSKEHTSFTVFYSFDCWNVVNDQEFSLTVKIKRKGQENAENHTLKGKIKTGHGVKIGDYLNANAESSYAYDGFGGADKATAFIPKWNTVYEEYFGSEKDFDSEKYIYDIAPFLITPEHQQPYDISGTIKPNENGEVIGGIYMMNSKLSKNNTDNLCIKLGANGLKKNKDGGYDFSIRNDDLILKNHYAAVSGLSDPMDNTVYTLYFLVGYEKSKLHEKTDETDENKKQIVELTAELKLKHTGVDDKRQNEIDKTQVLYKGEKNPINRVYWASYNPMTETSQTGLTSLENGTDAFVKMSADFYCLNENRNDREEGDRYRLEAIIDQSYLLNTSETEKYKMLGEDDYEFHSFRLCLIDAPGAWSNNGHGVPNVGWKPEEYGRVPDWAYGEDAKIRIYGSKTLSNTGNNSNGIWEEIAAVQASEVWAQNRDRSFVGDTHTINTDGYVRLKVVYNSRLTTALRVEYQMKVKPSVLNKMDSKKIGEDGLNLRCWFNYLGYDQKGVADLWAKDFDRAAIDDSGDIGSGDIGKVTTYEAARQYDEGNPYPGFASPAGGTTSEKGYSLRNRATVTLKRSEEAAGMLVTQTLYESDGTVVGDRLPSWSTDKDQEGDQGNPAGKAHKKADSFSKKKDVENVSEIVYSIVGVITNGSTKLTELTGHRGEASDDSPYKAMKQRYYVLLPDGLTLNTNPKGKHISWGDSTSYLSPSESFYAPLTGKETNGAAGGQPESDGNIPGWFEEYPNGADTDMCLGQMLWDFGSIKLNSSVQQNIGSKGQLYIFDRYLTEGSDNRIGFAATGNPDPKKYTRNCWGQGFSFSVVPKRGTGTLPQGTYEPQFWCQFLDRNDKPISMKDFGRDGNNNYSMLKEAYDKNGNTGSNLDQDDTLLYIPIDFTNKSASGSSKAEISVSGNNVHIKNDGKKQVDLDSEYRYELKYQVTDGKTKGAVLWCNIEGYDHNDVKSDWRGIVQGVDLNGNQNVKVYVRTGDTGDFNVNDYLRAEVKREWLTDGNHGWTEVENLSDYTDWAKVKSIAFDFGANREFKYDPDADSGGPQSSASVFINMKAPDNVVRQDNKTIYTAYNELIFSDSHLSGEDWTPGYGPSNETQLDLFVPGISYELPSTGGTGIYWYTISGMLLMMSTSLILYKKRRKRAAQG